MIHMTPMLNAFALAALFLVAGGVNGSLQTDAGTDNTVEGRMSEIENVSFHVIGLMKTKSGAT